VSETGKAPRKLTFIDHGADLMLALAPAPFQRLDRGLEEVVLLACSHMSPSPDPYEVLGLAAEASDEDIRSAYRTLCQIFHPDRFESSSTEVLAEAMRRMQEVNWAYGKLRGATGTFVYWDTVGWSNIERGRLTAKLLNREIPHRWNGDELAVDRRFEAQVDRLLDP
jgi:hypothetical protein